MAIKLIVFFLFNKCIIIKIILISCKIYLEFGLTKGNYYSIIYIKRIFLYSFVFSQVEVGSIKNEDADLEQDLQAREDALSLSPDENELLYRAPIDVALIFTNADKNNVIQHHLRRAVTTLLKNAHAPIRLHIISEEDSFEIGSKIIKNIQVQNQWDARHMKVKYGVNYFMLYLFHFLLCYNFK